MKKQVGRWEMHHETPSTKQWIAVALFVVTVIAAMCLPMFLGGAS